jgi:hypothetical protein
MNSSRTVVICAVLVSLIFQSGCALLYELQPHRMQRLNRGAAPSLDPEFTHWKPARPSRLADGANAKIPTLSANSADEAVVRAQSPVEDLR